MHIRAELGRWVVQFQVAIGVDALAYHAQSALVGYLVANVKRCALHLIFLDVFSLPIASKHNGGQRPVDQTQDQV